MANVILGNVAGNQPESVHAGVIAAICRISISATTSAGDVLKIGKLPNRAIPLEAVFYTGAAFVSNLITKFGLSGTEAAILTSDSYSVAPGVYRNDVNLALLASYTSKSDEATQRFTYITCTPTDVLTAGHYGTLIVTYKIPGQSL
jgi:hypothetical protein